MHTPVEDQVEWGPNEDWVGQGLQERARFDEVEQVSDTDVGLFYG